MVDNKLFSSANGRHFRIQATVRGTGKNIILATDLSEAEVRRYEPSSWDKKYYKYFKVAFNDSKR